MTSVTHKTAYLWGPVSSFSGPLAATLVTRGWTVHIPTKSSLNLFSLSPLDLRSSARGALEQAFGGRERFRTFQDRIKFIDQAEGAKQSTTYDAVIFCGLPPNFDEPRVPRAPWAATELPALLKYFKEQPIFVVSSIWGGVQTDGVVPEECEFERRKPTSHFESICQQYENKIMEAVEKSEAPWYLIRLPMIAPDSQSADFVNYSGPLTLIRELAMAHKHHEAKNSNSNNRENGDLKVSYNPDYTLWFSPSDQVVNTFCRYLEDESRPRVLNLVSTEATLNREWLSALASEMGFNAVVESEKDTLNLPGVLRKMLNDNLQVKTRNLFEVAGRYGIPRARIDNQYFHNVAEKAELTGWGVPQEKEKRRLFKFTERLAAYYFEEFIPLHFDEGLLKRATSNGTTIGFIIKDADGLGWILRARKGKAVVERFDPEDERPRICFHLTSKTMSQMIQSKLPMHRALLLREIEVEGPLLHALKVANTIEQFLKEHPLAEQQILELQEAH
ncbi:MAG: SCP2 sterol-binding domain-containing protein [Candidatus Obscuribacterales bacterium]|nr:SCP2 sterol-binding domain-containing protein [Candidatus Obscuribacterales bacterium]